MDSRNEKLVRFNNDGELTPEFYRLKDGTSYTEKSLPMYEASAHLLESTAGSTKVGSKVFKFGRFRVFPESQESLDQPEPLDQLILDPGSEIFLKWNRVFLFWCLVSLFVDPLFFLLPSVKQSDTSCMDTDLNLAVVATFFRTVADIFYILRIVIGFRTAYVSPVSRVFGKGELVRDPKLIARRYLRSDFSKDLVVALPFAQIVIWFIMPAIKSSHADHTSNALLLVLLLQYVPRLYLVFPLSSEIIKATKVASNTAWAGAAFNLLLYVLGSHLAGACWYLLATERNAMCLESECENESSPIRCLLPYLDCRTMNDADRMKWANSTSVYSNCDPNNSNSTFSFGIYTDAMGKNIVGSKFIPKYLYVLWWGLQQVSSYAQNLNATTFIGETLFTIHIVIVGLVLFALLVGNMQNYLLSITARIEKWRLERRDIEEWMSHRQLPPDLQERVRRFVQYKWVATRGVNEESILRSLAPDLRRDIQRHLCLDLVRRVHFFSQMDDQLLDAICERLVSSLSTQGTYIVREGDPVTEMLFIIRGVLESSTTNGGLSGFFNSITLRPGDFCGEELLSWALLPNSSPNLPSSTRTIKALVEVEAFALRAADVKFIANQFRRLHSKKLQNTFRFYSHHWRTWAACFIQAAWRRHKKRLLARNLSTMESFSYSPDHQVAMGSKPVDGESIMPSSSSQIIRDLFVNVLSSRLAANRGTGTQNMEDDALPRLPKPEEPDFSVDLDHI